MEGSDRRVLGEPGLKRKGEGRGSEVRGTEGKRGCKVREKRGKERL